VLFCLALCSGPCTAVGHNMKHQFSTSLAPASALCAHAALPSATCAPASIKRPCLYCRWSGLCCCFTHAGASACVRLSWRLACLINSPLSCWARTGLWAGAVFWARTGLAAPQLAKCRVCCLVAQAMLCYFVTQAFAGCGVMPVGNSAPWVGITYV
jgi:hypothetical protein